MKNEICECGHGKYWHQRIYPNGTRSHHTARCSYIIPECKCKKFVPKKLQSVAIKNHKGYVKEEDCHCFCCGTHSPQEDLPCGKCNKKKSEHKTGWGKQKEYCSFYPNIHYSPQKNHQSVITDGVKTIREGITEDISK